jgi:hypothetical protein
VISPEDPPGFIVRTELHKAADNKGFRLEYGVDRGWLHFGSTTALVTVWLAGASKDGPWFLSLDRPEVAAELPLTALSPDSGPGAVTFMLLGLSPLYEALDHAYRLGLSLPDAPLRNFNAKVAHLPRTTEAERLVVQRIGQSLFREALMAYWGGRCPLTGISDPALLRASHIVPWAECGTDAQRLDVHNGLLLSALWDAAFDCGLVSFADDGSILISDALSDVAQSALAISGIAKLIGLTDGHRINLKCHRTRHSF